MENYIALVLKQFKQDQFAIQMGIELEDLTTTTIRNANASSDGYAQPLWQSPWGGNICLN